MLLTAIIPERLACPYSSIDAREYKRFSCRRKFAIWILDSLPGRGKVLYGISTSTDSSRRACNCSAEMKQGKKEGRKEERIFLELNRANL